MFSGIIAAAGTVLTAARNQGGARFRLAAPAAFLEGVIPGASIAVNGACQTVETCDAGAFTFFSSAETLEKTNLKKLAAGAVCNLERALTLATPLDGHLVTGHVDTVARVTAVEQRGEGWFLSLALPAVIRHLVAEKGSLAVNGVSLTVNRVRGEQVELMVIPFTFTHTNLHALVPGAEVNLEADILARYTARLLECGASGGEGRLARLLADNGFT